MPGSAALSHEQAGSVESVRLVLRFGEANAAAAERSIELALPADAAVLGPFELQVACALHGAALRAALRVRNRSATPVRLAAAVLEFRWHPPNGAVLSVLRNARSSDAQGGVRPLAGPAGGSGATRLRERIDRGDLHASALVGVVGAAGKSAACLAGVFERGQSFGTVYLQRAPRGVCIEIEQRVDAVLAAGEERSLEAVYLALGGDAALLLERFADAYGGEVGARVSRPFLASLSLAVRAQSPLLATCLGRQLEALASLRAAMPIDVVALDAGWPRAVGDWLEATAALPDGLAAAAEQISAAGFIPGLWSAPLCLDPESRLCEKHPEWLLGTAGGPLCERVTFANTAFHVLDPSRDDVCAHIEAVYRTLAELGFEYFSLDALGVVCRDAQPSRPSVGPAQRLRRGLEAVRAGAGEGAFLLGVQGPLGAATGVLDAMRVVPEATRTGAVGVPDCQPCDPGAGMTPALTSILGRVWAHRRLWINDAGSLPHACDAAASALASAMAGTGSLLTLGWELVPGAPESRALGCATLATARTVDGLGIPSAVRLQDPLGTTQLLRVAAMRTEGELITCLNTGETAVDCTFEPAAPGAPPGAMRGVELCIGEALAHPRRPGIFTVAAHGAVLMRVQRDFSAAVFCDFDGTFSIQDVGSTIAQRHAAALRPGAWARYERGEISAWQYNLEVLDGLALPVEALDRFLHTVELDPGAARLLDWCAGAGVPFRILSDGFDWNLNRLQVIHSLRFAYTANHLHYERGRWRIRPGFPDEDCACGTGTCKGAYLRAYRAAHPQAWLVHIGNGRVSDTCGALAADLTFAKDALASELAQRGVAFEPFATLHDVIPVLERRLAARAHAPGA
jgi:2-hydroxy-3-keto-5-methylthiopentenyl-1-phosphate phosphatase